jgi:PAS domain S-box-containing protein
MRTQPTGWLAWAGLAVLALHASATPVRVGVYGQEPVASLRVAGQPVGLGPDIITFVARQKGWQVTYVSESYEALCQQLERGGLDLLVPAPWTGEAAGGLDYGAESLLTSHGVVCARKGVRLATLGDLAGKTVAVARDDSYYLPFKSLVRAAGIRCEFVEMAGYESVLGAVSRKRADAGLVDAGVARREGPRYGIVSTSLGTPLVEFRVGAWRNRNRDLVQDVDYWLGILKRDPQSEYYRSLKQWVQARERWPVGPIFTVVLAALLGVGVGAVGGFLYLRRRGRRLSRHLLVVNRELLATVEEHARREQQEETWKHWYLALLNSTPDVVLVHGVDKRGGPGKFIEANETACRRLGFTREELLALSPLDLELNPETGAPPPYAKLLQHWRDARLPDATEEARQARPVARYERTFRTKGGGEIPMEVTVRVLEHESLPVVYYSAHDITGRRQTLRALEESERRFADFFARSPIGVALYDSRERLLEVNQAALAMFGFSERAQFGQVGLFESRDLSEDAHATLAKGGTVRYEAVFDFDAAVKEKRFTSSREGKHHFDVLITNLGLDQEFNPKGYLVQLQDVTEQRRAEDALRQHERLLRQAQKMEAIGTLAGGIAHDFNNILTPIIGYTEMAMMTTEADDPVRASLEEVLKASHRAKELVKQILTFSRQTEHEIKPIRLTPLVKEVVQLLKGSVLPIVEIRCDLQAGRDIVRADPTQMHQVLMNLCTNAVHAMGGKGGVLDVALRQIAVDGRTRGPLARLRFGSYADLSVRDTGHGMDRATLDRIFEPFFTTKRSGEGTGMGLAVVHGIIASLQGAVTVESEPGKGSVFHVVLPLLDQAAEQGASTSEPLPRGTERILFVDDEAGIVQMATQLMTNLGYRVVSYMKSGDALTAFREDPAKFDLLISDQIMPQMTGVELIREVRRIRPGFPVLLCTGYSKMVTEEDLKAEGIAEVVMKPIVLRNMAEAIRRVLEGQPPPAPV